MKEKKQTNQHGSALKTLIVLLLVIILLATSLGLFAWAKYVTSLKETAVVDVAKWNFDLTLRAGERTVTSLTQTLDLATTTYQNIAEGKIAPGTSGEFDVVINTKGTEVSMLYTVTIGITDCPRNITFSRQKGTDASTLAEVSAGGTDSYTRTITFSEFLTKENASGEFVEKIKWNWPYEGTVNESATTYDTWDTIDNGKTAKLAITVVGTEMMNQPLSMGTLKNGNDVITNGSTINMNVGDTTTLSVTGTESVTFSSSDSTKASVNSTTGEVTALAVGTSTITLTGNSSGETMSVVVNVTAPVAQLETSDIGKVVNYKTTLNGVDLNSWRLLNLDGDYAYIILDGYLPLSAVEFQGVNESGDYGFDTDGAETRGVLYNALTTKSNWSQLVTNGKAKDTSNSLGLSETTDVWAIGSPTIEMFADSWNIVNPDAPICYEKSSTPDADGLYGYRTGKTQIGEEINYSNKTGNVLYFPYGNDSSITPNSYWIATPAKTDSDWPDVLMAVWSSGYIDSCIDYYSEAFRPVIRVPLSAL